MVFFEGVKIIFLTTWLIGGFFPEIAEIFGGSKATPGPGNTYLCTIHVRADSTN